MEKLAADVGRKKTKILALAWLWQKRKRIQEKYKERCKTRIYVRPIFSEQQRIKFGAGTQLMAELKRAHQADETVGETSSKFSLFKNFLRMDPVVFSELLSLVGPHLQKVDIRRNPISPEIRLAITLRYLASGDSMRSFSYLFRVGISTVSMIISETTSAIWTVLKDIVLKPPDTEEWLQIANGFKHTWQYPNCIGAIDGKHVIIQAPPNSGSQYYNYKGSHSIVLLALVSHDYSFSLVDIGAYGRQSDGGIFSASLLGQKLKKNDLNLPSPLQISEERPALPFVIVGDEAFPLLENLMRPYPFKSDLSVEKSIYNYRHCRARRVSENAFAILAQKWRIYRRPIIATVTNSENIIKATVCLHNFLIRHPRSRNLYRTGNSGDTHPPNVRTHTEIQDLTRIGANTFSTRAKHIREEFQDYFNEEGAVPWQYDRLN